MRRVAAIGLISLILLLLGCSGEWSPTRQDNPPGSTARGEASTQAAAESGSSTYPAGSPVPGATGPAAPQCTNLVKRSAVSVTTDGLKVTFYVPTDYEGPGTVWAHVWLPAVNAGAEHIGPTNEPFSFYVSTYGTFDYQIAGELDLDGDKRADEGCQDDRHRGTFSTTPPSTPPPPPPPPPVCDQGLLAAGAALECGELGYELNLEACTFTCNPAPGCEENEVLVNDVCLPVCEVFPEDSSCAPECEFGEASWNGEGWECPEFCEVFPDADECQPPPGLCYYEIAKPKKDKQPYCEAKGGTFSSHDGSDHCIFDFPGIIDSKLNLAPGLSAEGCLRKQDD